MAYVAPKIDAAGLTIPTYQDILDYLIAQKKAIYGSDIYLENDSTDYQELSAFALMIFDVLQTAQLVYNNRSPVTAIGASLDSIIKLNGMSRIAGSHSTVDVTIIGTVGTVITNGVVRDINGNKWDLPSSVTIPTGGEITVTATAQEIGAITATPDTVTAIDTPIYGWISVTNASAATSGTDVEEDSDVRIRQSVSTTANSLSILSGITGAIANLDGVTKVKCYENKTDTTDANGVPGHHVAYVVEGGDSEEIAETLAMKITPGTGFHGTTSVTVTDEYGLETVVDFFRPAYIPVDVAITAVALDGYTSDIGDLIKETVADYISDLKIGDNVMWSRVLGAALLTAATGGDTFNLTGVTMAINGSSPYSLQASDITIGFANQAVCEIANVSITVV